MNWKAFTIACVSIAAVSFPQNIIGCGPGVDPYDYYTSFFYKNLPEATGYQPFYYTGYNFLYDNKDQVETTDLLAEEWEAYCNSSVSISDAKKLVNKFSWKDLNNLYTHIEKKQPLKVPDSVKQNSMTNYFIQKKDLEALGYILYAKKVEPFVLGDGDTWELMKRDAIKMDKLVKNGQQLHAAAKKDFFKIKYAYQILRLAHYSERYQEVIDWYDQYLPTINTKNVLSPLCMALKAGALFRTGKQKEAAYLFSKTFSASPAKRVSNYLGFKWSINVKTTREEYLQYCKNNVEKAAMLSLFAMGSIEDELSAMKQIYDLHPAAEELEVLAIREINKREENYFTPSLQNKNGGKALYLTWFKQNADSTLTGEGKKVKALADFLHNAADKVKNPGLFEVGAAYCSFMIRDYATAKQYLTEAEKMILTPKVKDQLLLTKLLITINEQDKIDKTFEENILPSVQWLTEKAKAEKPVKIGYDEVQQWKSFYRNLMSEIFAKHYHQQHDLVKETLVIGAADKIMQGTNTYYNTGNGLEFLRNKLESTDVEKLYTLFEDNQNNTFENYLIHFNDIKKEDVIDFAGTAYLRENNYTKAIEWFNKSTGQKNVTIESNPFIDLLYDRINPLPSESAFRITKLAFAQEMLRLEKALIADKANAAKHYYKIALGLYNITYYGHAWKLVQYYRSGVDGYFIPTDATGFQKEYYGCVNAKAYFEKAMNASTDNNFKARCLFMMAKCSQKQIRLPQYDDYENYDLYDSARIKYFSLFKNNPYFPQLVNEYANTPFYKEAFNSCSYLIDFVKKKN